MIHDLLTFSHDKLFARLSEVVDAIISTEIELAYTQKDELAARVEAYSRSRESSISARDNDARHACLTYTVSAIELSAALRALHEEKWFLIKLLDHAGG